MLRVNEHYVSVQGEGPHVGELTQFLRFSGCNMRCPGWPCDTPHAVLPQLWKLDPKFTPEVLVALCNEKAIETAALRICLTGGEPLMQPNDDLRFIVQHLTGWGCSFDIFSNGSFIYPEWLIGNGHTCIVMDWKLPGSGEHQTKLEERMANARQLRRNDAIKFVVADLEDLETARSIFREWIEPQGVRAKVYVGSAWKHITDDEIVQYMIEHKLPWKLNVQVHKHIWGEQRGV